MFCVTAIVIVVDVIELEAVLPRKSDPFWGMVMLRRSESQRPGS